MADIGSLIIKIGADASQLESAFKQLGGSAAQFQRGMETIGRVALTGLGVAASAIVAMTIASGKQAEELQQLAAITGINTDKLQEYDVAMNRAGLQTSDMVAMTRTLSQSLDQARRGIGTAGDRFRQLGIDVTKVTSTDDLLRKFATAISQVQSGFEKTAIGSDLAGKQFANAIRIFDGGTRSLDAATKASKDLGRQLSTIELDRLAQMDDQLDDLQIAWKRFSQQIGVTFEPAVTFVINLFKQMLVVGGETFRRLSLAADLFAIDITHIGLAAKELGSVLFTDKTTAQAVENIKMIMAEAARLKKVAREQFDIQVAAPEDTRPAPPKFVDSGEVAKRAQSLLDAQMRAKEQAFAATERLNRAGLQNDLAILDEQKASGIKTEYEVGIAKQEALVQAEKITASSLQVQLDYYREFTQKKLATYTTDEKGMAERLRFEEEAAGKTKQMITDITTAQINADTVRRQSGLQIRTFWQKQLDAIVDSNAFSVGLIINTWTSGVANAIVNGGNFIKQAWKQTQVAIIQGALNFAIQQGAILLRQAAAEIVIRANTAAAIGGIEAAKNSAIIAGNVGAAGATVSIWAGASTAILGFFGTVLAGFEAMVGTMVETVTAVGVFVEGVLSAIAEALTATVFGIPWAGAIVAGIVLIAAALAATGNLGFKEGGIGDFGKGTQATLHGPEAIIPLNQRGAKFMQKAFGNGGEGGKSIIHTHVYLNGREIARAVSDDLPSAWRANGLPAT